MTRFAWNEEREAYLVETMKAGKYSGSEMAMMIAKRFGCYAPTRNSVLGKVMRLREAGAIPPSTEADQSANSRKVGRANAAVAKARRMAKQARITGKAAKRSPAPRGEYAAAHSNALNFSQNGNHKPLTSERLAEIGEQKRREEIRARRDAGPEPKPRSPRRRSFLDLGARECKWPHGDPGTKGFHFCGRARKTGLPYCEFHQKISRSPNQPKPMVRAPKGASSNQAARSKRAEEREPALDDLLALPMEAAE